MLKKPLLRLIAMALILTTALSAMAGCDVNVNIFDKSQETGTSDTSDSTSETPATTGTTENTGTTETTGTTEESNLPDPPAAYDPERVTVYDLDATSPVLVTGRTIALSEGLALDLSASSMRFITTGGGDVSLTGVVDKGELVLFTVFIDNVRQEKRIMFSEGESTQVIAQGLSNEKHLIEVVRQTEGQFGTFTAKTVTMKGSLFGSKPAEKKLYIEFIGDSITCGAGCLCKYLTKDNLLTYRSGQTATCIRSGEYQDAQWLEEDATKSFAYLTARALNADCSLVSHSSIGLTKSWGGLNFNMQDHYKKGAFLRDGGETYDFSTAKKPDFVVVNLGTNDVGQTGITQTVYKEAVKNFINQIRTAYGDPNLKIVWAVGLMGNGNYTWAKAAIDELNDSNIYTYQFSPAQSGHGNHPSMEQHEEAAYSFRLFLKGKNLTTKK